MAARPVGAKSVSVIFASNRAGLARIMLHNTHNIDPMDERVLLAMLCSKTPKI